MKEVDGWMDMEDGSSSITKFKYVASTGTLDVVFKAGTSYCYFEVPEEVAAEFLQSESKGGYLSKSIKGTYKCAKAPPLEALPKSKLLTPGEVELAIKSYEAGEV